MKVEIREATLQDIELLAQLVSQFWEEHSRKLGSERRIAPSKAQDEVQRFLSAQNSGYFIALDEHQQPLGFRRWEYHDEFYFTRELYVIPAARRHGVARALLHFFEQWVQERGQDIAVISCTPHNLPMMRLARSEGYTILNLIEMRKNLKDDARPPRGEVDALGFTWEIL